MKTSWLEHRVIQYGAVLLGCAVYSAGLNWFIIPVDLYSGGMVGIAQLLAMLAEWLVPSLAGNNLYGLLYFLINVPVLLLAWSQLGRPFFLKTMGGILGISVFITLIPVPAGPILDDILANVLLGSVITGVGIGLTLTARGSCGGLEVVGVWLAKVLPGFTVGRLALLVNTGLFAIFLLLFDVSTVLYSMIYMAFYSKVMDLAYAQTITVNLMIFTKKSGVDWSIMRKTARGVTEWKGKGAYTGEETNILVTVINKYEIDTFLDIIRAIDPAAFVIRTDGVHVMGNFERRL